MIYNFFKSFYNYYRGKYEKNKVLNLKKSSNREVYIDIARGISILLMITGHVLTHGLKRSIIFSFHMPLYIITSGFFYKEKLFKDDVKNLVKKLLIPTTIVLIVVFFINNVSNLGFIETFKESLKVITVCWSHKSKINYSFGGTGVLWFIYILIVIRLLFRLNKIVAKENEVFLFLIVILETYLGYIVGLNGYWLPWSLDVSFSCMLFYYVGYIFNKYKLLDVLFKNYGNVIVILIIWLLGIKYNWIELAVRRYPNGLWSFLTAISGTIIILKASMFIESKYKLLTNFFSWCGKNSLYILFGHHIESSIIKYNHLVITNQTLFKLVLSSLKCLISISFAALILFFKRLFNKKDNLLRKQNKNND